MGSTLPPVHVREKVSNGGGDTNILPPVLRREKVGTSRSIVPLPVAIAVRKPAAILAATLPPVPVRQRGTNAPDANTLPPVIQQGKTGSSAQEEQTLALPPVVKRQRANETVLVPSLPPIPSWRRPDTNTAPSLPPVIQRRPKGNIICDSAPSHLPIDPSAPVHQTQRSKLGLPVLGQELQVPGRVIAPAHALASIVGPLSTNMERGKSHRLPKQALAPAGPGKKRKVESPSISESEEGLSPEMSNPLKHRRLGDPRPFNPLSFKVCLSIISWARHLCCV